MNLDVGAPQPRVPSAGSGAPFTSRFLAVNLESLRILPETAQAVCDAEPLGRVAVLDDGTIFVQTDSTRLGLPIPSSEVFSQLQGANEEHIVVVFGLGTGQLPKLARTMCPSPIVVYEPDPAILRTVLSYGPLDLGNIPIVSSIADLTRLWRDFSARLVDVRVLTTPGYYKAYPNEVHSFVDAIPNLLTRTAISKATYQNRARVWVEDIIQNVELLTDAPPFLSLTDHYQGVPAFIIGAGPSLDKNIDALSEAAQKGIVFATNSGAVALARRGIEPQVICCIESIDASSKLESLPFMSRVVRAFSLAAAPQTLRCGTGPLLPVHEAVAQYNGPLQDLTGYGGLPMSGSVSTIAMSLARVLGCSPIVLVGQDLAYSGGRTYATGTGYESSTAVANKETGVIHLTWNDELIRVHGQAQGAPRNQEELRRLPAWGGQGEVDSGLGFIGVQAWFEATAELMQKSESSTRLINATEGGVHIAGYEELPLRDLLATLSPQNISAASIAAAARAAWTPIDRPQVASWFEAHARASVRVRRVARRLNGYSKLAAVLTRRGDPAQVTRIYDRLERAEAALREAVMLCPLVDAWSHRALDVAMALPTVTTEGTALGPHRAAEEALEKSSRVAEAVELSARQLETALKEAAARLRA
jgi:hypothetical protein